MSNLQNILFKNSRYQAKNILARLARKCMESVIWRW